MRLAVVNGPNLNMLGRREPELYGTRSYSDLIAFCKQSAGDLGVEISTFQSNHEGVLIDHLQALPTEGVKGVVINAASLTHTSVGIRDALLFSGLPFVEVHLSNVFAREAFRHQSLLADRAIGVVSGLGFIGYQAGLMVLVEHVGAGEL